MTTYRVVVGKTLMLDNATHAEAVNHRALLRLGGFNARLVRVKPQHAALAAQQRQGAQGSRDG